MPVCLVAAGCAVSGDGLLMCDMTTDPMECSRRAGLWVGAACQMPTSMGDIKGFGGSIKKKKVLEELSGCSRSLHLKATKVLPGRLGLLGCFGYYCSDFGLKNSTPGVLLEY